MRVFRKVALEPIGLRALSVTVVLIGRQNGERQRSRPASRTLLAKTHVSGNISSITCLVAVIAVEIDAVCYTHRE